MTGRMRTTRQLLRSVVPLPERGGAQLPDGSRLIPDPILAGSNPCRQTCRLREAPRRRALGICARFPADARFGVVVGVCRAWRDPDLATRICAARPHSRIPRLRLVGADPRPLLERDMTGDGIVDITAIRGREESAACRRPIGLEILARDVRWRGPADGVRRICIERFAPVLRRLPMDPLAGTFAGEDEPDAFVIRPDPGLVAALAAVPGDIPVLAASGKKDLASAGSRKRAAPDRPVVAMARFSAPAVVAALRAQGLDTGLQASRRRRARAAARLPRRRLRGGAEVRPDGCGRGPPRDQPGADGPGGGTLPQKPHRRLLGRLRASLLPDRIRRADESMPPIPPPGDCDWSCISRERGEAILRPAIRQEALCLAAPERLCETIRVAELATDPTGLAPGEALARLVRTVWSSLHDRCRSSASSFTRAWAASPCGVPPAPFSTLEAVVTVEIAPLDRYATLDVGGRANRGRTRGAGGAAHRQRRSHSARPDRAEPAAACRR